MHRFFLIFSLAFKDWKHESLLTLCSVLSLASILLPLLVLAGVKNGVINTLRLRLLNDPAILSIIPAGSGLGYTLDFIEELRQKPDVSFAIPKTRELATTIQLTHKNNSQFKLAAADIEPTASGDPLLQRFQAIPECNNELSLSQNLADKLGVQVGSNITALLGRTNKQNKMESLQLELTVKTILPPEVSQKNIAYALLPFLELIEDYRDYEELLDLREYQKTSATEQKNQDQAATKAENSATDQEEQIDQENTPPSKEARRFARFRIYAKNLEDVAVLRDYFTANNIEVITSAREIQTFQELDKSLAIIFTLIALTVALGFVASTASNVLAGVRRKDKELGMIRLIGCSGFNIMLFPLFQALLTGICGTILAGLFYLAVSLSINSLFSNKLYGEAVADLPITYFLIILVAVLALSTLASLYAALRAAKIQPSEVLRQI